MPFITVKDIGAGNVQQAMQMNKSTIFQPVLNIISQSPDSSPAFDLTAKTEQKADLAQALPINNRGVENIVQSPSGSSSETSLLTSTNLIIVAVVFLMYIFLKSRRKNA